MSVPSETPAALVVSVAMGYGHLRAAWPLADRLGVTVTRADRPPVAGPREAVVWDTARRAYEALSRLSQTAPASRVFGPVLDRLTAIAPHGTDGEAHRIDRASRSLAGWIDRGFGHRLGRRLDADAASLVTTFYAPALAAERHSRAPVFCVVTDSEVHRVWAPVDGRCSRIHYLVPAAATGRRLESYGVRPENISTTGFPLPPDLVARASSDLERRLGRLRTEGDAPPLITFAVGGAGAQAARARQLLWELAGSLRSGELRLALVAGLKKELAARFRRWAESAVGRGSDAVEVLHAATFEALYRSFNALLARTDMLWTKPSELSFYAALGLPLILDDPVGDHERANARSVLDAEAAVLRPQSEAVARAICNGLSRGAFARAAENGFRRLPRNGTERIVETVFNCC